jgi:hypothetical protein
MSRRGVRERSPLRELLTGIAPSSDGRAPGKTVIPGKSLDEMENFNRGLAAGIEASRYNPKSTGVGYGCGYFGGITVREYRNQMVREGCRPPAQLCPVADRHAWSDLPLKKIN